jgi:hypothetical protein
MFIVSLEKNIDPFLEKLKSHEKLEYQKDLIQ